MTEDRASYNLDRFVRAQAGVHDRALAELREGAKRSCWMWYVFPQILGLGRSENARFYALASSGEALAYWRHDLLDHRLTESTEAMLGWAGKRDALSILGPIDTLKFISSMTLFEAVADDNGAIFGEALAAFADGKRDPLTLAAI